MGESEPKIVSAVGTATGTSTGFAVSQFHSPLPSDHPFYANVGRVASEWAQLEHLLDTVIWAFLQDKDAHLACITSQVMGFGPRCKAILALGKYTAFQMIY